MGSQNAENLKSLHVLTMMYIMDMREGLHVHIYARTRILAKRSSWAFDAWHVENLSWLLCSTNWFKWTCYNAKGFGPLA